MPEHTIKGNRHTLKATFLRALMVVRENCVVAAAGLPKSNASPPRAIAR